MSQTDRWNGSIFPMTDDLEKEDRPNEEKVIEYLKIKLKNPKDHKFN